MVYCLCFIIVCIILYILISYIFIHFSSYIFIFSSNAVDKAKKDKDSAGMGGTLSSLFK
mgnify:CR=1 FL=1